MALLLPELLQQGLDELIQVINLLQFSPAVLVEPAVARQDMQCLQQFNGLAGADIWFVLHGLLCQGMPDRRCPPKAACLLVPMRGVEPPTFALRMRAITSLPSLSVVGIIHANQHVTSDLRLELESVALIEIHQNTVLAPTWCLHGANYGTKES